MTEHIKVSVIVPIYNKAQYLEKCLDTIIGQTLQEIELILIDDGSTDNSAELCKKYLSDPRVSYYYKENEGLAAARQDGMERSRGEYIGFIDADDWIELDMFEKMYGVAKEYDVDVVYCNRVDDEDGHRPSLEIPSGLYDRGRILSEVLPKTLAYISKDGGKRSISWSNCRRIFRKKLLDDNGIAFDRRFRRSQDLMLTYEAMICAKRFYHMGDDRFYHTRTVPDSLSRGYTKNMWPLYVPLIERLYKDTEEFKELDLMPQMHLRAFFWVTDCIDNEFKPLCPNDKTVKLEKIKEIVNHPLCDRFIGHIPTEKLNGLLQGYYSIIEEKRPEKIFSFRKKYFRKQKRYNKFIRPVINKVSSGKITGKIYKKIRHKK